MERAMSSLPVPVSPEINTVDFDRLKSGIIPVTWRKHGLVPISISFQFDMYGPPYHLS